MTSLTPKNLPEAPPPKVVTLGGQVFSIWIPVNTKSKWQRSFSKWEQRSKTVWSPLKPLISKSLKIVGIQGKHTNQGGSEKEKPLSPERIWGRENGTCYIAQINPCSIGSGWNEHSLIYFSSWWGANTRYMCNNKLGTIREQGKALISSIC